MPFRKVLIANRGEIACRIARALREMGVPSLAVYSQADAEAPHVRAADEAALLGGPRAQESYLKKDRIIEVARERGADALHPGYGFLSENAAFARQVIDAGLTWIGPHPQAMQLLGRKTDALRLAREHAVPVIPGSGRDLRDTEDALRVAGEVGYPVLLKASGGGGGIGMVRARSPEELGKAFEAASKRVAGYFGDGALFIERAIDRPRHVEVQIIGDKRGNVRHLLERECSVQRRNQKVIEEGPSPADLPRETFEAIHRAAVTLARAVGYDSAGTVEFLVSPEGSFHFIEVNTRLQVEHPVTEMITGVDIVKAMVAVAAGDAVPVRQEDVRANGWAIEARIYAEDPEKGFAPSPGTIASFSVPAGDGLRHEVGVAAGQAVTPFYDPLLSKVIAWGDRREEAVARLSRGLSGYVVEGVKTNLRLLREVVESAPFREGKLHTGLIEEVRGARAASPARGGG